MPLFAAPSDAEPVQVLLIIFAAVVALRKKDVRMLGWGDAAEADALVDGSRL